MFILEAFSVTFSLARVSNVLSAKFITSYRVAFF